MPGPEPRLRPEAIIERVRRLGSRRERDRSRLCFVEGVRGFIQAADAGASFAAIVHSRILLRSSIAQKIVRLQRRAGVPVAHASPERLRELARTPHASGICAAVRQHWTPLDRLDPRRGLCWLALSRLQSPGNLGTIVLTAEAVGAGGLIVLGRRLDPFDPVAVRASMGGLFHLALARTSVASLAVWARRHGCRIVGTSPAGATGHTEMPVTRPLVLMLGEERSGLSPRELAVCTDLAALPVPGTADSLNVGVAAGVFLYEILRRQSAGPENPGQPYRSHDRHRMMERPRGPAPDRS